jgi:hypothetical protein
MTYCHERIAVKSSPDEKLAISLPCRAWTCDRCAPVRKKQLMAEGMGGAPNTFLTLTCRVRPGESPELWAPRLARAWRLLRLRFMRLKKMKKLPFLAVMEKTENGWPHLHIQMRNLWMDQEWISDQMLEMLDSPVVWIERIDNKAKIAGYCSKYAGKAAAKYRRAKRYWKSRDYDIRTESKTFKQYKEAGGFELTTGLLYHWILNRQRDGWLVEEVSSTRAIARPPPQTGPPPSEIAA